MFDEGRDVEEIVPDTLTWICSGEEGEVPQSCEGCEGEKCKDDGDRDHLSYLS